MLPCAWLTYVCIYPIFPPRAGCYLGLVFKLSEAGLISEFSFSLTGYLTQAKESILPYHLPIAKGRIDGFMPFPSETRTTSSRIWTRGTDNRFTKGVS